MLRLGTRGSALALHQAELVRTLLLAAHPGLEVRIQVVQSLGDLVRDRPLDALGAEGIFTRALEHALAQREIDLAVHSAKDLPSSLPPGFAIAASPAREDPRDCLVSADGATLDTLPHGARVGTGSPRRVAQLRAARPDLACLPVRGNVDTRRRAALERRLDAVVLAAAGLKRLGLLDRHARPLSPDLCLPQAGQGILAVETRDDDRATIGLLYALHNPVAGACLEAERSVLSGLAAGCQAPVAAFAEIRAGTLHLRGLAASLGGETVLRAQREGPVGGATPLGRAVAAALRAQGAADLLAAARGAGT